MNMGGMGRNYLRVFVLLALVVAVTCLPGIQTAKAETDALAIKIMPFGDSITASYPPFSSYRCYLDHMLDAANIYFIFSGSQYLDSYYKSLLPPCGDPLTDFDNRHEGYSGYPTSKFLDPQDANYIDDILSRDIYQTAKKNIPQIVLMHLGTNDLNQSIPIPQIVANLGTLIDHFRAWNPSVAVLVAQIIPCTGYTWCSQVDDLNAAIPALAAEKNNLFSPVVVVDMYSDYNPTAYNDPSNPVHPNSSGDAIIAARWMAAIQAYLNRTITQTYVPIAIK